MVQLSPLLNEGGHDPFKIIFPVEVWHVASFDMVSANCGDIPRICFVNHPSRPAMINQKGVSENAYESRKKENQADGSAFHTM